MANKKSLKKSFLFNGRNKWIFLLVFILSVISLGFSKAEVTLKCGANLPDYKYSLRIPFFWQAKHTRSDWMEDFYELKGAKGSITVSCTTQGVGGGCEDKYHTTFDIWDGVYSACFDNANKELSYLSIFISDNPTTTISFWSDGLSKVDIIKIISTLKINGKNFKDL